MMVSTGSARDYVSQCPTQGCTTRPPAGFMYCPEHAGSERGAYDRLDDVLAENERLREFAKWAESRGLAKDDSILLNQARKALRSTD